jgi:hypothetical protein
MGSSTDIMEDDSGRGAPGGCFVGLARFRPSTQPIRVRLFTGWHRERRGKVAVMSEPIAQLPNPSDHDNAGDVWCVPGQAKEFDDLGPARKLSNRLLIE